jgi:S-DNA-T family DNA segregation ATPase FtsK/SpoIIIE
LLVDTLGVASFISVIYLALLGLTLCGVTKCRFWSLTFKCLYTSISLSIILGLLTYNLDSPINWGGNHGHYVNQWLLHVSDALGAYAVTIILFCILVSIYLYQIKNTFKRSGEIVTAIMPHKKKVEEEQPAEEEPELQPIDELDKPEEQANLERGLTPTISFEDDEANAGNNNDSSNDAFTDRFDVRKVATNDTDTEDEPADNTQVTFDIDTPSNARPTTPSAPTGTAEGTAFDINVPTIEEADGEIETTNPGDLPEFDHRAELSHYVFPPVDLLIDRPVGPAMDEAEQQENKDLIVKTLLDYKIPVARIEATVGPTVTLYEIVPAEGVRIAQIKRLEDDIALSLAALGIRIIAPIPGKGTVGIEVPNRDPKTVSMRTIINSRKFAECNMALPMAMGATISNDIFIEDLARMPHLLVAGATGQGKSVGLNCIIASLLYKKHPTELKFVLIDPKMVEFSLYKRLERHYLAKLPDEADAIITDPSKAVATLNSLCIEMDKRYELLSMANVRSLEEYNRKFAQRRLNPEKGHRYMPYIVMIVDEFADLIMTAGKEISMPIARIAQKARAVGMHMIIATQRPSTDVITGMIKANFPGRIAFRVSQRIDSMTILDRPGANQLIGRGDMLFSHNGKVERVQCAFIDTEEVDAIAEHIDNQIGFETAYLLPEPQVEMPDGSVDLTRRDDKFDECARFVVQQSTASTSSLQRRFGIGYNKAGKIMDQMQAAGIVGPADGSKPRAVLIDPDTLERILANN